MLSVLAALGYYLYNTTLDVDDSRILPIINFDRSQAVLNNRSYQPGLLHVDQQERAGLGMKDPGDVRGPYGGNPDQQNVNMYGITTTLEYQEAYKQNIRDVAVRTVHPVLDPVFNSPILNFDTQGHQLSYPGVHKSLFSQLDNLNATRPHWSPTEIKSEFKGRTHNGQLQPTFLPQRYQTK